MDGKPEGLDVWVGPFHAMLLVGGDVEIIAGFKHDDIVRLKQVDWTQAIVDGAQFIARRVSDKVENEGGGTLNPPIWNTKWGA